MHENDWSGNFANYLGKWLSTNTEVIVIIHFHPHLLKICFFMEHGAHKKIPGPNQYLEVLFISTLRDLNERIMSFQLF